MNQPMRRPARTLMGPELALICAGLAPFAAPAEAGPRALGAARRAWERSGPSRRALRGRHRVRLELAIEEALGIDRSGQRYLSLGSALEAHPGIVRLIADQDHE